MNKRKYDWEDVKKVLLQELSSSKHILTFGTIGSLNVEHDIDTIITKKASSSSSDFYKEVHKLFDSLNKHFLKKYNARVFRFACFSQQELALKLGGFDESKDLAFHTMIYTSYHQIEGDWGWALYESESMDNILRGGYQSLKGDVKQLFDKSLFAEEIYHDPIFIRLYFMDYLHLHLEKGLLLKSMNHTFDYIYRKRLKLKAPVIKNDKDVRSAIYKLCDILDVIDNKHTQ